MLIRAMRSTLILAILFSVAANLSTSPSSTSPFNTTRAVTLLNAIKKVSRFKYANSSPTTPPQASQAAVKEAASHLLPGAPRDSLPVYPLIVEGRCLVIVGSHEVKCSKIIKKLSTLVRQKLASLEDVSAELAPNVVWELVGGLGAGGTLLLLIAAGLVWRCRRRATVKPVSDQILVTISDPSTSVAHTSTSVAHTSNV